MQLTAINTYLAKILQPEKFNDYCPNGLQVEGKQTINKIVTGVTASLDLLHAAHEANADAILVHHGYFWKGESAVVTGIKKQRLQFLLQHEINLFAYHLPLDAHNQLGNNVMLGNVLGLKVLGYLDDKGIMAWAELEKAQSLKQLAAHISNELNRKPLVIGDVQQVVKKIAWCTGAAQDYIDIAIANDIDVFISGEISEPTVHSARESNTAYISAGHHATERYGVKALGEHLAEKFNIQHVFIDIDNPV